MAVRSDPCADSAAEVGKMFAKGVGIGRPIHVSFWKMVGKPGDVARQKLSGKHRLKSHRHFIFDGPRDK